MYKILIVDDDPDMVEVTRIVLEGEGYEVDSAPSLEAGLVRLEEGQPDLLTPDVAEETHAHIESALTRRGLIFGGRALCTVLRPRLTTPREVASLQARIEQSLGWRVEVAKYRQSVEV